MKRLTEKSIGVFQYNLKGFEHKPKEFNDYDAFYAYSMAVKRLGELEDVIEAIHETLDLADELRAKCRTNDELAISNSLSLGKIAVITGHTYEG